MNIIGILGQSGSGKDTAANQLENHNYAKISLADPIKRLARHLFLFSIDQLWGSSEKRNEFIDINWPEFYHRFQSVAHYWLQDVFGTDKYHSDLINWANDLNKTYPDKISARIVCQSLGTNFARSIDPDVWINYGIRTAEKLLGSDHLIYTPVIGLKGTGLKLTDNIETTRYSGVVLPDCRFINEVNIIKQHDGKVIKIIRPGADGNINGGISNHQSEMEQKLIPDIAFDYIIINDKTLEEFNTKINSLALELSVCLQKESFSDMI